MKEAPLHPPPLPGGAARKCVTNSTMASALSCAEPEKMRSIATTSTLSTIVAELTASTSASLDEFRTRA